MTSLALINRDAPSFCGIAIAVENPGGQTVSDAVESSASQEFEGTRSVPCWAREVAAPTYAIASGSSPGPAPLVMNITRAKAATPSQRALSPGRFVKAALVFNPRSSDD
jgi:hypothetical protein